MTKIMMNLNYDNPYIMPELNNNLLILLFKYFNIKNHCFLTCKNKSLIYKYNDCHNNVNKYLLHNNHNKILGYYLLYNTKQNNILGIQHSVILKNNKIYDITPCNLYNKKMFIYGYNLPEYKSFIYDNTKIKTLKTTVNQIDGYFL